MYKRGGRARTYGVRPIEVRERLTPARLPVSEPWHARGEHGRGFPREEKRGSTERGEIERVCRVVGRGVGGRRRGRREVGRIGGGGGGGGGDGRGRSRR